jgi:hypothetical protein
VADQHITQAAHAGLVGELLGLRAQRAPELAQQRGSTLETQERIFGIGLKRATEQLGGHRLETIGIGL